MTSHRREPLRPLRLFGLFFRIGALNELQYRANFAIQVFQSVIALGTGLAVLGLVFSQTTSLNDWTQPELLAVMGVHILMGGVIRTVIQPNMERLMTDVREGTLDFVLTKPEDAQVLVSVRDVKIWQAVDIVVGFVVLGIGVSQVQATVGPMQALAFAAALLLGGSMIYCFWLIITTGAFWIVRMDEVHELFDGLYQSGRWPVTIYPGWLRISLTFLVPIAFAVTVPAEALTSRLTIDTLALAAGFALALLVFTRWWWRFGLRRYSGASA
ncbi:MAG TPA: ABC-2 family transporter protein [Candidatus Limnocylindrales bacterium]|nr:ABC-2 family transporter protein [Candidatus Limnocylindrales bacterium]